MQLEDARVAKPIGADKIRDARYLDEAFGAELTRVRVKGGWSQAQFSELVGYDETYIRQLERGRKSPTLRTLADIAAAVSEDVSSLIKRAERRMRQNR